MVSEQGFARRGLIKTRSARAWRRPIVGSIPQDDASAVAALQRSTPFVVGNPASPSSAAYHEVVRKLTGGILQKLKTASRPKVTSIAKPADGGGEAGGKPGSSGLPSMMEAKGGRKRGPQTRDLSPLTLLKMQVHSGLIKEMDLKKDIVNSEGDPAKARELRTARSE